MSGFLSNYKEQWQQKLKLLEKLELRFVTTITFLFAN